LKAEKANAIFHTRNHVLAWVHSQSQAIEVVVGDPANFGEFLRRFAEDDEIIDVANVRLATKDFFDEVVEGIEVDIGEELAGLVAQR